MPDYKNLPRSKNIEDRRGDPPQGMLSKEWQRILEATGLQGFPGFLAMYREIQAQKEFERKFQAAANYYWAKTGVQPDKGKLLGMVMPGFNGRAASSRPPEDMHGLDIAQNVWDKKVDLGPEYGMLTPEEAFQTTNKGPQKRPRRSRKKR